MKFLQNPFTIISQKKKALRKKQERLDRIQEKRSVIQGKIDEINEHIRLREAKIKRDRSGLKGYFESKIALLEMRREYLQKELNSIKN